MFSDFMSYIGDDNNQKPAKTTRTKRVRVAAPSTPVLLSSLVPSKIIPKLQPAPVAVVAAPASAPSLILHLDYSPKSFAIFGDTKAVKDQLFDLGGSFNRYLKRNGQTEAGYIFSNKRLPAVRSALNL